MANTVLIYFKIYLGELLAALPVVPAIIICERAILKNKNILSIFTESIFVLYICAVFFIVGLPSLMYIGFDPTLNLIPFADIVNYPLTYIVNSLLNVLLFVPLGVFVPILWPKFNNLKSIIITGFLFSLFIEIMQLFAIRVTDIDDIIFNTLGALAGFFVYKIISRYKFFRRAAYDNIIVPFAISFTVMFFIQPYIVNYRFI